MPHQSRTTGGAEPALRILAPVPTPEGGIVEGEIYRWADTPSGEHAALDFADCGRCVPCRAFEAPDGAFYCVASAREAEPSRLARLIVLAKGRVSSAFASGRWTSGPPSN